MEPQNVQQPYSAQNSSMESNEQQSPQVESQQISSGQFSGSSMVQSGQYPTNGMVMPPYSQHPSFVKGVNQQGQNDRTAFLGTFYGSAAIVELLLSIATFICMATIKIKYLTFGYNIHTTTAIQCVEAFSSLGFILNLVVIIAGLASIQIGRGEQPLFNLLALLGTTGIAFFLSASAGWFMYEWWELKEFTWFALSFTFSSANSLGHVIEAIVRLINIGKGQNVPMQQLHY